MNNGNIVGNEAKTERDGVPEGGGVYVTDANSTFTMSGSASIVGNTANNGGGVYVSKGNFKMSGGTIGGAGEGDGNTAQKGGGVYVTGTNSTFTMNNGSIVGNTATSSGGGVYVTGGTFTLNDGSIAGNEATKDGGGVYVIGSILNGIVYPGTFTMEGSASIKGNTATGTADGNEGGGVYVAQYGVFTMSGGTIGGTGAGAGNTATDGGGVYVADGSTFNMDNGNIVGNTATDGGGVCIKFDTASKGTFNMTGSATISGNTAQNGGGVYSDNGLFEMTGGTISGNTATVLGGGVYVMGVGTFTMKNGRIIENNTAGDAGGVYVGGGTFTMEGGEITGNTAGYTCGGVYVTGTDSTFNVSKAPVIRDNKMGNADNNVYLNGADKLKLTGPLSSPAEIHITNPVSDQFGIVDTSKYTSPRQSDADHFVADSTSTVVAAKLEGTILKWVEAHTVTIDNTIQHGEITAFPAPAYNGATVTLTATPDTGYQLKAGSLTYTPDGGSPTTISGNTFTMPAANVTVTAEFEIPVKKSSSSQGTSTWISTIPSVPGDNTVATDVTYQYTGQKFIPVSAANLEQISAADPAAAAAVELVLQTAAAAGIPLTNSKGAKAIVNTTESVPGTQTETFSQVIEVTSADGSKVTSVPFKVHLSDLTAKNLTTDDVTLYHYLEEYGLWIPLETGLVSTDDVYAYYEAATDGASPFGVLLKKLDAPEVKPIPTKTPAGKSPVPFAGVLAGLGAAAAVFAVRRK